VDGRVPLYVGSGGISTAGSIALTQAAEAASADVAMLITPYFISPTADEVVDHFQTIARATALPILIYSNPPRTHLDVAPDSFRRMAEVDNIIGIKDSSGDMTQMIEYLRVTDGEKLVFAGRDTLIQASLQQGITGAISPGANVFPSAFVQLHDLVTAGEHDRARALSNLLAPLRVAWSLGSFPVVIKEAMALVGRGAGSARKPIHPLTPENRAKLRTIIERIQHDLR
jgi:4-hydroxy-tetrahydrodipicolinate synthase